MWSKRYLDLLPDAVAHMPTDNAWKRVGHRPISHANARRRAGYRDADRVVCALAARWAARIAQLELGAILKQCFVCAAAASWLRSDDQRTRAGAAECRAWFRCGSPRHSIASRHAIDIRAIAACIRPELVGGAPLPLPAAYEIAHCVYDAG